MLSRAPSVISVLLPLLLLYLVSIATAAFQPIFSGRVSGTQSGSHVTSDSGIRPHITAAVLPQRRPASDASQLPFFNVSLASCGVSGIHAALTHLKTIVFIDRTDANNSLLLLPGTRQYAYASEWDWENKTAVVRPLDVKSNVFCSSGQFLPDGTLLSIGGSTDASSGVGNPMLNGSFSIRSFSPCTDGTCDFSLAGTMTTKRWYPTSQILPDGRIIIYGGANVFGNIAKNAAPYNNPTYEFWPRAQGEGNFFMDFLARTVPFNLYPFVHLLPSGNIFLFAGNSAIVHNYTSNQEVRVLPFLSTPASSFRSYPVSGSSALLPLRPSNNYSADILICGGSYSYYTATTTALSTCHRIQPEAPVPSWTTESMQSPRVMPDLLHLVDGTIAIVNGARVGYQGLKPTYAGSPALNPIIYSPDNPPGSRVSVLANASKIARMYHSSALIMPDATVLISGSNPNPYYVAPRSIILYPTEMRVETFYPPYLHTALQRPQLVSVPDSIALNTPYSVSFTASRSTPPNVAPDARFKAVILDPGFSTHNQRHGMRYVELALSPPQLNATSGVFNAIVTGPPSMHIAPATKYWFHILDNGLPNTMGMNVNIIY